MTASDYRRMVGLAPAQGGSDATVPMRYQQVSATGYRMTCLVCATSTPVLDWQTMVSRTIRHRCMHVQIQHGEKVAS